MVSCCGAFCLFCAGPWHWLALFLYPIVWLILLPFRIVGIAVGGVLELVWAIITLPARVIRTGSLARQSCQTSLVDVNPLHSRVDAAQHAVGYGPGHSRDLLRVNRHAAFGAEQRNGVARGQRRAVRDVDGG